MLRAFTGTVKEAEDSPHIVQFDTDSFRISIERKGITVGLKIEGREILKFRIDDDDGVTYTITSPNSIHTLDLPMVLVYPQHWAKHTSDGTE